VADDGGTSAGHAAQTRTVEPLQLRQVRHELPVSLGEQVMNEVQQIVLAAGSPKAGYVPRMSQDARLRGEAVGLAVPASIRDRLPTRPVSRGRADAADIRGTRPIRSHRPDAPTFSPGAVAVEVVCPRSTYGECKATRR
jgi:hypothetical protein